MPDQFEQPDLRSKDNKTGDSYYQHPHTGERVPSITTISGMIDKSGFLVPWAAKLAAEYVGSNIMTLVNIPDPDAITETVKAAAKRERDKNRDLGSLAHNTIEALCRGQQIEVDPRVQHHVNSWLEWISAFQVKRFVLIEETVWSHQYHYAGTMDVIAEFGSGEHCLVDYKTGNIYADAAMQLNAIARADVVVTTAGEFPMPQIDSMGLLHLPAPVLTKSGRPSVRGKWSFRPVAKRDVDWRCFLALREAYDWEHIHSKTAIGGKQTKPPENTEMAS